jgi:hypothetical protein
LIFFANYWIAMQANIKRIDTVGRAAGSNLVCILCLLAGLTMSNVSYADRPLPANGVLGVFKPSATPNMVIDNQPVKLGAGAQIRNEKNMIVQPAALSGADVHILYKKGIQGQIDRIWILTEAEYERISQAAKK